MDTNENDFQLDIEVNRLGTGMRADDSSAMAIEKCSMTVMAIIDQNEDMNNIDSVPLQSNTEAVFNLLNNFLGYNISYSHYQQTKYYFDPG